MYAENLKDPRDLKLVRHCGKSLLTKGYAQGQLLKNCELTNLVLNPTRNNKASLTISVTRPAATISLQNEDLSFGRDHNDQMMCVSLTHQMPGKFRGKDDFLNGNFGVSRMKNA